MKKSSIIKNESEVKEVEEVSTKKYLSAAEFWEWKNYILEMQKSEKIRDLTISQLECLKKILKL